MSEAEREAAAAAVAPPLQQQQRSVKRKGSEWEILANLEKGVHYTIKPKRYEGYLSKRRKWPLKGWHKRFFVMEQGVLTYAKTKTDIARGRTLGKFNIGETVISANYADMRIDIDADESVHHVKADNMEAFGLFMEQLQQHRLFTQNISNNQQSPLLPLEEGSMSPCGTLPRGLRPARSNLNAEFAELDESINAHMEHMNNQLSALVDMVGKLEDAEQSGQKKRLFNLRKKKSSGQSSLSNSKPSSAGSDKDRASPVMSTISSQDIDADHLAGNLATLSAMSNSNPSLNTLVSTGGRPISLPADGSLLRFGKSSQEGNSKEDVVQHAHDIQNDLCNMMDRYRKQRDHIKMILENESKTNSLQAQVGLVASLRQSLNTTLQQNTVLRNKLARIHAESELGDIAAPTAPQDSTLTRGMNGSLSYSSSCISEFFDAREYADSGEDSDDDGMSDSDVSDTAESGTEEDDTMFLEATASTISSEEESRDSVGQMALTGRRRTLPVPKTETEGVNLWNLLRKNIGKDLSKISMPVTLNEPLSTLQRLCEELEYTELLEKAVHGETPLERMQWVVAFSISSYGSSNARASHKPFNPLLGETFECVRDDKGFKFVSEQVSHHPPVSAAHASGSGWEWAQCLRIRSKFWGKSMEFQPEGKVCLTLHRDGEVETYNWNKVTSCIHNLLGAERWVDLYGESVVSCEQTGLSARIQFVKASYWSTKRHELFGTVSNKESSVQLNLFGKWSEALYVGKAPSAKCIWRPGSLPDDSQLYYGFSRFAMELNELVPAETALLPPTDVRWRPDQRALENGKIGEAENIKLGVEQAQRDRRRQRENGEWSPFKPLWFDESVGCGSEEDEAGPERWTFNGSYWNQRNKGFQNLSFESLW